MCSTIKGNLLHCVLDKSMRELCAISSVKSIVTADEQGSGENHAQARYKAARHIVSGIKVIFNQNNHKNLIRSSQVMNISGLEVMFSY